MIALAFGMGEPRRRVADRVSFAVPVPTGLSIFAHKCIENGHLFVSIS